MIPMVKTATMMRASDCDEPFWNSSQTNLPRPGFWASISAAIKTIQPTPSDSRSPVKINGINNTNPKGNLGAHVAFDGVQHRR